MRKKNNSRIEILVNDSMKSRLEELRREAEEAVGSKISTNTLIVNILELFLEASDPAVVLNSQTPDQ